MATQMTEDQLSSDLAAIRRAALDYMQGWYEGDAERMQRCLHTDLTKRGVRRDPQTGKQRLGWIDKQHMVEMTQQGGGSGDVPAEKRTYDVAILDVYGDIASVRATSYEYVDYLHLARSDDGSWLIVNVLWAENHTER